MSPFTLGYVARAGLFVSAALVVQGCLIFLSWSVCRRSVMNAHAAMRYRLACCHLAACLIFPVLSIGLLHLSLATGAVSALGSTPSLATASMRQSGDASIAIAFGMFLIWLAGAIFMVLRLFGELQHMAQRTTAPATPALIAAVTRLSAGWVRCPRVIQSPGVRSPEVIGLGRSILVAPLDFTETLTVHEQDAVLLHELAHLKRSDFGWNLLQRLILASLWFHPAVWMLYAFIRREREICCDAMAVGQGAHLRSLATGLVRLAGRSRESAVAMGAAPSGELVERIRRLVDNPTPQSARTSFCLASGAAVSIGIVSFALSLSVSRDALTANLYVASAFGPMVMVEARDPLGSFVLNIREGRVISATLGGHPHSPLGIHQIGEHVALIGTSRRAAMRLTVTASNRVSWTPRT